MLDPGCGPWPGSGDTNRFTCSKKVALNNRLNIPSPLILELPLTPYSFLQYALRLTPHRNPTAPPVTGNFPTLLCTLTGLPLNEALSLKRASGRSRGSREQLER